MFRALFKYDRINFSEGALGLQAGSVVVVLWVVVLVLLLAGLIFLYRRTAAYPGRRGRAVSLGIRTAVLCLLFVPLFEPVLVMPDIVPDENFVAVLVDASESMNVPDAADGRTRAQEAARILSQEGLVDELGDVFKVRMYRFGDQAVRTDSVGPADERGTNVAAALDRVLTDFRSMPLSGVVLLTDGADNSTGVPLNQAEAFRNRGVPLEIVGLGREDAGQERELLEAGVSRGIDRATGAEIDVKVRSWRKEDDPVAVSLYDGDELVQTSSFPLKGGGMVDQFTLYYEPKSTEAREYQIRVDEAPGETNTDNNALSVMVDPGLDTLRVLFLEGHPRQEFKFIKRALEDDSAVHFTSILRTATSKYYRQGVQGADDLAGGFAVSDEELFGFQAILFGDVEAAQFSLDQLEMVERFVRLRGGGFAMLGGRVSFAEGAYWNTPVADLLPVTLDPGRRSVIPASFVKGDEPPAEQGYAFVPTAVGLESPILRLVADPSENRTRWSEMPGLTSINYLGSVKPGATVLAEKQDDDFGGREPLFIVQRYGRGRSAALATASTWRWHMLLDADDRRHARFWRQFVRWLAASAPNKVDVDLDNDRFEPDDEIAVGVDVYNDRYEPVSEAGVIGTLRDSIDREQEVEFRQELGRAGRYTATVLPAAEGIYRLDVEAEQGGSRISRETRSFLVRPSRKEYHDAVLKRSFLEQIAAASGGRYYSADEATMIPADLRGRRTSTSIYRIDYLWDMPILFALVLLLLSADWIWRRRKGMP